MSFTKLVVFLILVSSTNIQAQQNVGYSFIGLNARSWPCRSSLKLLGRHYGVRTGFLFRSFGSSFSCLRRILQIPEPKRIRVHVQNGACLRNQRCFPGDGFYRETITSATRKLRKARSPLLRKLNRDFRAVAILFEGAKNLTCYCSPVLESDFAPDVRRKLLGLCAKHMPQCKLVDNPVRNKCIRGTVCENHDLTHKLIAPCIADMDGNTNVRNRDFLWAHTQCDMALIWKPKYNCVRIGDIFRDPRQRDCKRAWDK